MRQLLLLILIGFFSTQLYAQLELSENERMWIERHPEITFGADKDWAPLVILNDLGKVVGYDRDILNEIERLTGLRITIQPGVWSDLVEKAKGREIDGLTYSFVLNERKEFFEFSQPYVRFEAGFYSHVDTPIPADLTAMSGSTVAVQASDKFSINVIDSLGGFKKVLLENRQEVVSALLTKQVDYYFGAIDLDYYLSTNVIPGLKLAYLFPNKGYDAVFSIRKDYKTLVTIINKALLAIPERERVRVLKKWGLQRQNLQAKNNETIFTIIIIAFGAISMLTTWALTLRSTIRKRKKAEEALKEYKVNLESVIENSSGLIYLLDFNLRVVIFNSNFKEFIRSVSGKTLKEGDDLGELIPERYKAKWVERYVKGLCGEKFDVEDYTNITGSFKTFISYFNPVIVDKKVTGLSCFTEDISNYALLNRYMISMMDNAFDYIFIKDVDLKFVVASQSMADVNGLKSWYDFKGKTDFDIHPKNALVFEQQERAVVEQGQSFVNVESAFIDKDGNKRWVESTNLPILDKDNNINGLMGVSRDITEYKRQDEANRTMLSVLDNSGDFVAFFDREMKFIYMNKVARGFYGSDNYLGHDVGSLMDPEQFERRKLNVLQLIKNGGVDREEVHVFRPEDGKKMTLDSVVVAVNDDEGRFLCFGNIGRDVTARNKLQEEVVEARLQKEVMLASMQAEDLERSRLAHELHDGIQQRLATLSMSLQISKDRPALLPENVSTLNSIIDEVRDISHNLSPSTLKSMGLTFAIADEVRHLNNSPDTKFKYFDNVGSTRFDELLELNLFRIFQESVTNIQKHAQAKEVMIQLILSDNNLSLVIEDDGIGFDTSNILDRGIGLANMKRRINAFNGKISIESSKKLGTTVMLDINL